MANVDYLRDRAELLRRTRRYFDQRGFLETQPPCLSRDCVVDAFLDPMTVDGKETGVADPRIPDRLYLQTSPESAMKRMLAAGAPSIYGIVPVFRAGEMGDLHNIEFSMLEWYEVDGDYESAIRLTGEFVAEVLDADGYETLTYREAFRRTIDVDPIDASIDELIRQLRRHACDVTAEPSDDRDEILDVLLSTVITPTLGKERPTIMKDYPLSQAALAKPSAHDPQCAARFELFVDGIELANGYDELLDANTLQLRFERNNETRRRCGRPTLAVDTTLLQAMRSGLPPCSGVALGLDRLLMLRVGAERIEHVMSFTIWQA